MLEFDYDELDDSFGNISISDAVRVEQMKCSAGRGKALSVASGSRTNHLLAENIEKCQLNDPLYQPKTTAELLNNEKIIEEIIFTLDKYGYHGGGGNFETSYKTTSCTPVNGTKSLLYVDTKPQKLEQFDLLDSEGNTQSSSQDSTPIFKRFPHTFSEPAVTENKPVKSKKKLLLNKSKKGSSDTSAASVLKKNNINNSSSTTEEKSPNRTQVSKKKRIKYRPLPETFYSCNSTTSDSSERYYEVNQFEIDPDTSYTPHDYYHIKRAEIARLNSGGYTKLN